MYILTKHRAQGIWGIISGHIKQCDHQKSSIKIKLNSTFRKKMIEYFKYSVKTDVSKHWQKNYK